MEGLISRKDDEHASVKKYPDEVKERVVWLRLDALEDPQRARGCFKRVDNQLGVNSETLRGWGRQVQVDAGDRPGTTTADAERIRALEAENRELRRANEILRSASGFFAAECERPSR